MGEKYHTITKRLLHCTLGPTLSDLASDELPEAVIRKIVLGLEGLLSLVVALRVLLRWGTRGFIF